MMSAMQNILGPWLVSLKHYAYMSLLLSSPERLPYHPQAIVLNIVSYLALSLFLVSEELSYARICGQFLLQLLMMGLITQVGLARKNLQARFVQTFSALTGTTLLIDAITIFVYLQVLQQPGAQDSTVIGIGLIMLVWSLSVLSLIFRRAFEISTPLSAIISISFFFAYHLIVSGLLE